MQTAEAPRVELFRLLGDEDRLRLLALCAQEELAVGELADVVALPLRRCLGRLLDRN